MSIQLTRPLSAAAPAGQAPDARATYDQIKAFTLSGGSAEVSGLALKRDRVEMTFTGTFYFAAPVGGKVTGAIFVGDGRITASVPPSEFERENLRRMIGAELVESDFKTVVLRWSDDTFDVIGAAKRDSATAPAQAQRLATESEGKFLQETGANLSARIAISMLNKEAPGIFTATFDGGRRGRFSYVLDQQGRIPVGSFNLNGGEKGVIYAWQNALYIHDVWMAFYSEGDYAKQRVEYLGCQRPRRHHALPPERRPPGRSPADGPRGRHRHESPRAAGERDPVQDRRVAAGVAEHAAEESAAGHVGEDERPRDPR